MDALFDELDNYEKKEIKELNCCDKENNYILHNGVINCKECGNVVSNISNGAEWRYYGVSDSKSSDPTRCGMPSNILLPESSVGSTISTRGKCSYSMYQVRKYHKWQEMPYKERSLHKVFGYIKEVCENNNIPSNNNICICVFI